MTDVRATYLRFPASTQHFWTWLTGKALPHQQPLIRHTWYSYLATTLACFLGGLALSVWSVSAQFTAWPAVLLVGWVLTLQGARTMVLVIAHQALHRCFSGSAAIDRAVGEGVTVLTVFQDFQEFKEEHFDNHHRRSVFATLEDPPVQFLMRYGIRPGLTRKQLWRQAWLIFVSPRFYAETAVARIRCNLTKGTVRRVFFLAWAAFWLSMPWWLPNGLAVLLLAFVVPVIVLAQLSALLDKLGEHAWLTPRDPQLGARFYTAAATSARFCGAPVPSRGLPAGKQAVAWARWLVVTLGYHLPCRLTVIVGDLPNHDFHHRYPSTRDWMIAAYARQRDIDSGEHGPAYSEVWGMGRAIDGMFDSLSGAARRASLVG